ncbi:DUF3519 domain-containing protein [Helicobacter pylori]|uniref:DUF3519 domain-containing protein n=1 Tax=Helicobacter pylori TaxID=210 RepID=UPI000EB039E3|nr:DUF3519 domain-containing protein [Helicobacter pylori]MCQ2759021.1 DUF3519 domain-containing protein [Helicobacter pylori]RKU92179.1 hypothetical protein DDP41_05375 [Helicobacter pylori]RKU93152.1 hypothetical protein DDP39_04225 [Helicobacter pylori]WQW08343.1 DUF3519 domain-containing protein [Helicobacter pylori]WRG82061.1 DUF3519 domain-containing protein [Helicobacter pylori]
MKSIKKPHLDHTQALSSCVSGSIGTLKVFLVWVRKLFSNPCLDSNSTKTLNNRKSELVLKTMFKSNGDYKNNKAYKEFSSTSLNANAKVPHRSSSHGGAKKNNT